LCQHISVLATLIDAFFKYEGGVLRVVRKIVKAKVIKDRRDEKKEERR
jgi:hypothetical protein